MNFEARSHIQPRSFLMQRRAFLAGLLSIAFIRTQERSANAAEVAAGEGQSTAALRSDAVRRIPMNLMTTEAQAKINDVVNHTAYFRRMPPRNIDCEGELFKQFIRYPEILIGIWDSMGATRVEINRVAPYEFRADDGAGTKCVSELLFGNENIHVYYSTGNYTGKLIPRPIDGRCLCIVHSKAGNGTNGSSRVATHLDVFLKLDSLGADLVVRTIGPLVNATADQNYLETLKFLEQLSNASLNNPMGVRSLMDRVRYVEPGVKEKFIGEVFLAADRASRVAVTAPAPSQR